MSAIKPIRIDLSTPAQREDHRLIRDALRRQCRRNGRKARAAGEANSPTFGYETTIGAIAKAVNLTPLTVAEHLENAHLVILDRGDGKLVEEWGVSEDGE